MDLVNEVKSYIHNYLNEDSNRNLKSLSKSTGVTYSTLQKLVQGKGKLNYRIAVCVLMVVTDNDTEKVCDFLEKYYPTEAKVFKAVLQKTQFAKDDLQQALEDEFDYFILAYIGTQKATRESVQRIHGESGTRSIEKLLSRDIVIEQEGFLKLSVQNYMLNSNNILNTIKSHALFFNKNTIGSEGACLYNLTESVNKTGLKKIKAELNLFLTKVCEIMDSHTGSIPIFINGMLNSYDEKMLGEDLNNE